MELRQTRKAAAKRAPPTPPQQEKTRTTEPEALVRGSALLSPEPCRIPGTQNWTRFRNEHARSLLRLLETGRPALTRRMGDCADQNAVCSDQTSCCEILAPAGEAGETHGQGCCAGSRAGRQQVAKRRDRLCCVSGWARGRRVWSRTRQRNSGQQPQLPRLTVDRRSLSLGSSCRSHAHVSSARLHWQRS